MITQGTTAESIMQNWPEERKESLTLLRNTILTNIPEGFDERISYGMISYVVPHSIYPAGYHCKPSEALPFISFASQKNFVAIYHMGLYSDPELLRWFETEYAKRVKTKLDMGKSCIRFKKPDQIPFDLIAELCSKVTVDQWIKRYESVINTTK